MRKIRVRLSGLALFAGNVLSFLLGFVFIVLISRNLSQGDLGAWFFIGSMLSYFQILEKVLPYWALRDSARGAKVTKTAFVFSFLLSLPLLGGFIISSLVISSIVKVDVILFLLASFLLPLYYVQDPLTSILYAKSPHLASLRNPIIDGVKIPLALLLLVYGLKGVLIAVILANLVYVIYLVIVLKDEIESKLKFHWFKKRFKHMWLPLFHSVSGYINNASDSFLIGVLLSPAELAYYGIGITISNVIKSSRHMATPFGAKLLSVGQTDRREVRSFIKFVSIFVIPMLVGGVLLSPHLFGIFGKVYVRSAWVLSPLLLAASFTVYSSIFSNLLTGLEKVDRSLEVNYRDLLKSRLFIVDLINYLFTAVLIVLSILLVPIMGLLGAVISRLGASTTLFLTMIHMSKCYLPSRKIIGDLIRIGAACLPMAAFLIIFKPINSLTTLINIAVGAAIYFAALYAIDSESRALIRSFVKEFSERMFAFM